jgi:hypothetical protein
MQPSSSSLLRNTLRADAVFCAVGAVDLLLFSGFVAALLGLGDAGPLLFVGAGLLAYAAYLFVASRREPLSLTEAWAFAMADLAWVAGSAALIAFGPLSATGNWVIGVVAAVVLALAELKMLGIRRIRRAQPRPSLRHVAA